MKAPRCSACDIELIPSSEHPRAGEIPTPMICACCGAFVDGTPEEVEACRASAARYDRKLVADEARARAEQRVLAAGGTVAPRPVPPRRPRLEQLDLFSRKPRAAS